MAESHQLGPIVIDSVVLIVATQLRIQLRPDFGQRCRQISSEPVLQIVYLRSEFLTGCLPLRLELARSA